MQLAPRRPNDHKDSAFSRLRWAQAGDVGYLPHSTDVGEFDYTKTYMAVAADLPDFDSPYMPYVYFVIS